MAAYSYPVRRSVQRHIRRVWGLGAVVCPPSNHADHKDLPSAEVEAAYYQQLDEQVKAV